MYRLETCPARYIWGSTLKLVTHPLFIEAMAHEDAMVSGGGLLGQPANWSALIRFARGELSAFREIAALAKSERKAARRK